MPSNYVSSGHFCTIQTGPWEGRGSWLYRIYCKRCGFEDLATNREDAFDAYREHNKQVEATTEEEQWEDF